MAKKPVVLCILDGYGIKNNKIVTINNSNHCNSCWCFFCFNNSNFIAINTFWGGKIYSIKIFCANEQCL